MSGRSLSLSEVDAAEGYESGARLSAGEADAFDVVLTAVQTVVGSRHNRELLDLMSATLGREVTLETLAQAEDIAAQYATSRRRMS